MSTKSKSKSSSSSSSSSKSAPSNKPKPSSSLSPSPSSQAQSLSSSSLPPITPFPFSPSPPSSFYDLFSSHFSLLSPDGFHLPPSLFPTFFRSLGFVINDAELVENVISSLPSLDNTTTNNNVNNNYKSSLSAISSPSSSSLSSSSSSSSPGWSRDVLWTVCSDCYTNGKYPQDDIDTIMLAFEYLANDATNNGTNNTNNTNPPKSDGDNQIDVSYLMNLLQSNESKFKENEMNEFLSVAVKKKQNGNGSIGSNMSIGIDNAEDKSKGKMDYYRYGKLLRQQLKLDSMG